MMWFSVICETLILPNIKGKGDKIQINYWGGGLQKINSHET